MSCATVKPISRQFLFVLISCNFQHRISRILLWNCFLVNRIDFNALQKFSRGLSARVCSPCAPVVCACSLLLGLCLNAGRGTENSSEGEPIVLALSCYQNGYRSEARATPVEDRRPEVKDLAKPWCGPIRPHRLSVTDWYTLMGASYSAVYGGSQVPGSWRSPSGTGVKVEVAEVDAPEQKKVRRLLLRNPQVTSPFSSCALVCHFVMSLR